MNETISHVLNRLNEPANIDLDALRTDLESIAAEARNLTDLAGLYEFDLQKEIRAKVDLCGPISGCATPESAFSLRGPALLEVRREARRRFNELYCMAPLCRRH